MQIIEDSQLQPAHFPRSVLTIGNFDGVHLGHQALLRQVTRRARALGATAALYTFHPHPLKVLNPSFCPPLLSSFADRAAEVARQGLDALVWARFDREYAARDPEVFIADTLVARLRAAELWVGPDFVFGRERRGSLALLRAQGEQLGFAVQIIEPFSLGGEIVSSTRIRSAVAEADFGEAERLLGRPYVLRGPVVHGAARGSGLGYPTANLLPREECLPPPGVYAAWARIGGAAHPAAVNVGANPTFGDGALGVEAHLLDFAGDLYGREMELAFVAHIRREIAFRSSADLVRQIHLDVEQIRRVLGAAALPRAAGAP